MPIQYIEEQNPVKADIVNEVREYPYALGSVILNKNKPVACANKSKLVKELFCENIQEMTGVRSVAGCKALDSYFPKEKDKIKRNSAIISA